MNSGIKFFRTLHEKQLFVVVLVHNLIVCGKLFGFFQNLQKIVNKFWVNFDRTDLDIGNIVFNDTTASTEVTS